MSLTFDPFVPNEQSLIYAEMAMLRRGEGVARSSAGLWFVSRYDDCRVALKDNRIFSNVGGMRAPGVVVPDDERLINEMDPPDHPKLRRFEQSVLNQAHFKQTEPFIRDLATRLIADLPATGPVDLLPALTGPVPGIVASHVIGVPERDHAQFQAWSFEVSKGTYPSHNRTERGPGLHGGHPEFARYIDGLVNDRRRSESPDLDDLVTRMVREKIGERPMTATELRCAIAHLIIAGHATTMHMLGNLFHRVLSNRNLYEQLRADRSLIPNAIDESLRVDSPVQVSVRSLREDVELSGVAIPRGERVWLALGSANRDEVYFGSDADTFRADRDNAGDHVAFGMGPHLCLGAGLARMEGRVVLEAFFDAFPAAGLAPGYQYRATPSFWELGPTSLEAVLHA
ncbi:cytochrome P450 [Myxococcota bacterium]|nr:cytochrome P450 [Myxococcota bacterium]